MRMALSTSAGNDMDAHGTMCKGKNDMDAHGTMCKSKNDMDVHGTIYKCREQCGGAGHDVQRGK